MTVSYSREVATTTLGTFARLLFRWRGSIYRLLYREVVIYLALYYFVCVLYHFVFSEITKRKFEQWSLFCQKYTDLVPLTFVLGFYVSIIVGRWWNIFASLTWPDKICLMIQSLVGGQDERGRMIRRTTARYVNLAQILVLRDISSAVRKRFPTLDHVVEAGFFTEDEYKQYESIDMSHHKFWVPLQWTCSLLTKARKEALIDTDPSLVKMIEEVIQCRTNLMSLICYDWVSVPLVYTQVVTIAVYSYFLACLFGRQFLLQPPNGHEGNEADMYFPLFTLLQFVFYMGWLKVAESIMNPLGEDDDDFEVNYLIDRNLQVSYFIVDDNCMKIPPLKRDIYWNDPETNVPYTQESVGLKVQPYVPSAVLTALQNESELMSSQSNLSLLNRDGSVKKIWKPPSRQNSTTSFDHHLAKSHDGQGGLQPDNLSSSGFKHSFRRLLSSSSRKFSKPELVVHSRPESIFNLDLENVLSTSKEDNDTFGIYFNPPSSQQQVANQDTGPSFLDPHDEKNCVNNKHTLSTVSEAANEDVDGLSTSTPLLKSTSFCDILEKNDMDCQLRNLCDINDDSESPLRKFAIGEPQSNKL